MSIAAPESAESSASRAVEQRVWMRDTLMSSAFPRIRAGAEIGFVGGLELSSSLGWAASGDVGAATASLGTCSVNSRQILLEPISGFHRAGHFDRSAGGVAAFFGQRCGPCSSVSTVMMALAIGARRFSTWTSRIRVRIRSNDFKMGRCATHHAPRAMERIVFLGQRSSAKASGVLRRRERDRGSTSHGDTPSRSSSSASQADSSLRRFPLKRLRRCVFHPLPR